MNTFFQKFVKVCPKTGRIRKIILPRGFYKLIISYCWISSIIMDYNSCNTKTKQSDISVC